jgi:hypothetical protein
MALYRYGQTTWRAGDVTILENVIAILLVMKNAFYLKKWVNLICQLNEILKHKLKFHVTHTAVSTARLELLSVTEAWDKCFQQGVAKTCTATVTSRS